MKKTTKKEHQFSSCICMTRYFYGPKTKKTRLLCDGGNEYWAGTRAEARELISRLDKQEWYLSHNEYSRRTYTVVKA